MSVAAAASWPPHAGGRTGQPVRRTSYPFEAGEAFFRPLAKAAVVTIMRAAERLAIVTMRKREIARVKKRHAGALTLGDLAVLQALLFRFMDWKSGRCAPTYDDLEAETGLARDTIAAAIRRLGAVGILERMRRFRRVEAEGEQGPQVVQAPNAYRFDLPKRLRALLGFGAEANLPDDVVQAEAGKAKARSLMVADESGLSATLAAWGLRFEGRELDE